MTLLTLLGGFALALIVASVTYRALSRMRVSKSSSAGTPRPSIGSLLFSDGQHPTAIVLSTGLGLLILTGFLYVLYPEFFSAFRASPVFVPTYVGIVVIAILKTRTTDGWKSLGTLVLLLLLGAWGREVWRNRPPSSSKPVAEEPPAPPQIVQELIVGLPKDGSWSVWVDTYGGGAKWFKATRHDFIVGTEAGEAYSSSEMTPRGRLYRFRTVSGRETRVQVTGARLSYVQPGIVPEPADVELLPASQVPREDSLALRLTAGEWSDTIPARGAVPSFALTDGITEIEVEDHMGQIHSIALLGSATPRSLPQPVQWLRVRGTAIGGQFTVQITFQKP